MAEHLSEEEQIEALKRWWDENKFHVVVPIFAILVGYLGWNYYQDEQQAQANAASQLYQDMSTAAQASPGTSLTDEQKEAVTDLAEKLADEHGGTLYADMATLLLARFQVEANELDAAAALLKEVKDQGTNESMRLLAQARLARVLSAQGEMGKALALVATSPSDQYQGLYDEVRGDIYLKKGEQQAAHTAYTAALSSLPPSEYMRRNLIQMKLSSVTQPEADASELVEPAEAEPVAEDDAAEGDA